MNPTEVVANISGERSLPSISRFRYWFRHRHWPKSDGLIFRFLASAYLSTYKFKLKSGPSEVDVPPSQIETAAPSS